MLWLAILSGTEAATSMLVILGGDHEVQLAAFLVIPSRVVGTCLF